MCNNVRSHLNISYFEEQSKLCYNPRYSAFLCCFEKEIDWAVTIWLEVDELSSALCVQLVLLIAINRNIDLEHI